MKLVKKILSLVCVLVTLMTATLPANAMAASKTYKGTSSKTYTITTGKKDATLKLKPSKGKRAQKYVKKSNPKKTSIDKWNLYGSFTVTVNGKKYVVTTKEVKVTLPANKTYHVTVTYNGVQPYSIRPAKNPFVYKRSGSEYWYKDPSIKLDVNKSAKIR